MKKCKIAFIGGGNMSYSLIGGLLAEDCHADNICVSDPDLARLDSLRQDFAVQVTQDNQLCASDADVVVLAVKPQVLKEVAGSLAPLLAARKSLIISVAAGIRIEALGRWLGQGLPIVRAMPNTPALVRTGASGLCANSHVNSEQRDLAESILRAVGLVMWVEDEAQMDVVTALSGSGPAYFFLVMEALQKAAEHHGLGAEAARLLTLQTAFGAAKMALESSEEPALLRARVTSPGGTTEQAINTLLNGGIETLFDQAIAAAAHRSRELADMLGGK